MRGIGSVNCRVSVCVCVRLYVPLQADERQCNKATAR